MKRKPLPIAVVAAFLSVASPLAGAADFAPYGTAKVDMHAMPVTDVVFDVNYEDPKKLDILYAFVKNTRKETRGNVTAVPAGFPELAYWQSKGYRYINPLPLPVRDVRYLDQPQLRR